MNALVPYIERAHRELKGRLIVPYQTRGLRWILQRELADGVRGGILADEVGLGKTIQLLAAILANPSTMPTLILCPKSLVSQWVEATKRFTDIEPLAMTAESARVGRDDVEAQRIVIAPYSAIRPIKGRMVEDDPLGVRNKLLAARFHRVVLDEGHAIKHRRSKVHQAARLLKADIRWVATATPVTRREMSDVRNLLEFVGLDRRDTHRNREELREKYILRRTQEDVARDAERLRLPPCRIETVQLTLSDEERALYDDLKEEGRLRLAASRTADNTSRHLIALIGKMRMIATNASAADPLYAGPKTKLAELVRRISELPRASRCIVFTHYNKEADDVKAALEGEHGIACSKLCGSMSNAARDDAVTKFRNGATSVLVSHIEVGGVGLNLQIATHVFISSPSWNAASEIQAIGRAHRTGVEHVVQVTRFVVRDTIEEHVINIQHEKLRNASNVLGDDRIMKKLGDRLTFDDFRKIFA